ncbi:MAG: bifunctional 2-polyprenyl-6-hydroxyphenol methylase/3-demethylubiquinol 3-O-methyltransferase UbiG [Alteromonadaceae bacterium]|nr:bifunctional 2-polyprenyl-6-hydroxyphenol methylase/3-demethylubiquinol 3-O-methyltransferase UbiG [Alteromonadaceae bacterium]
MLDKSYLSGLERQSSGNYSEAEIARFDSFAEAWWDPNGAYKRVLDFNAMRWSVIEKWVLNHFNRERDLSGLSVLDIGCGGGLLCEPFARLGAAVTGIDASEMSVEVAKRHALKSALDINYQHCLSGVLVEQQQQFDIVINTEVIEHVPDQAGLAQECCELLKPGGALVMGTLNRTIKSFAFAIVGAEYVLKLLPKGTHEWRYFVKPSELTQWLNESKLEVSEQVGVAFNPVTKRWRETQDMSVNYLLLATKREN